MHSAGLQYVFCVGDSRTGTTSFHEHAQRLGFNSVHHYEYIFNAESVKSHPEKVNDIITFVQTSGCNCFSDYPTRTYYAALYEAFPDSLFVNTVRSTESWLKSCKGYFTKAGLDIDYEKLAKLHVATEKDIKNFFKGKSNYLEVNICESEIKEASSILNLFLAGNDCGLTIGHANQRLDSNFSGVESNVHNLPYLNGSKKYTAWNLVPPSQQFSLYKYSASSLEELVLCLESRPTKACLSEKGHAFLCADTSKGFHGIVCGDRSRLSYCIDIIEERRKILESIGASYTVFVVPEKVSLAPHLLPKAFDKFSDELHSNLLSNRLAGLISAELGYVYDLAPYFRDIHESMSVLFRFDSHLNFTGSHHLFLYINEILKNTVATDTRKPTSQDWSCKIGTWNGDLLPHLERSELSLIRNAWRRNSRILPIGKNSPSEQFLHYYMNQDIYELSSIKDDMLNALHPERPQYKNTASSSQREVSERPIVYIHDSSIDKLYTPLSTLSKNTCFYWNKQMLPPLDHELMLSTPNVVQVIAERFLYCL